MLPLKPEQGIVVLEPRDVETCLSVSEVHFSVPFVCGSWVHSLAVFVCGPFPGWLCQWFLGLPLAVSSLRSTPWLFLSVVFGSIPWLFLSVVL